MFRLDCPSDMEQRDGRIERQGNENPEVQIYRYVTDRTFDAYLYQMLENKQRFISQVMTSKTPERVCSDIDETALDYAEVKALCAGNPLIKEEMELRNKIKDLKMEKKRFMENMYELQENIRVKLPNEIKMLGLHNKHNQADLDLANSAEFIINDENKKVYPITINGTTYTDRKEGGNSIKAAISENFAKLHEGKTMEIGEYRGMKLSLFYNNFSEKMQAVLDGNKPHYCELNPSTDIGNIVRLDNCINNIAENIKQNDEKITSKKADLEQMMIDVEKPFPKADELLSAETRLEEVHIELAEFEKNDDSLEKDLYERLCDQFPEVMAGQTKGIQVELPDTVVTAKMADELLILENNEQKIHVFVDYENEKANITQFGDNPISSEKEQKNTIYTAMDKWLDKIEDNSLSVAEIERNPAQISR